MLAAELERSIPLPHTFSGKNTIQLTNHLRDIPLDKELKSFSFDITNMSSNIAIIELIKVIKIIMCEQSDLNIKHNNEIIKMCKILTKQNN
jgi:hypothetical protein